jgi:hypothetical protein
MSTLPIGDYALLSDCRTVALVSRTGSVDWLCFPRFDGPAVFARLLDDDAGHFAVRVPGAATSRRYLDQTMALETTFRSAGGTAVLADALAVGRNDRGHELGAGSPRVLLRRVACTEGEVEVEVEVSYAPRPEHGLVYPLLEPVDGGIAARGGADRPLLSAPAGFVVDGCPGGGRPGRPHPIGEDHRARTRRQERVTAGPPSPHAVPAARTGRPAARRPGRSGGPDGELAWTLVATWEPWLPSTCTWPGPKQDRDPARKVVRRPVVQMVGSRHSSTSVPSTTVKAPAAPPWSWAGSCCPGDQASSQTSTASLRSNGADQGRSGSWRRSGRQRRAATAKRSVTATSSAGDGAAATSRRGSARSVFHRVGCRYNERSSGACRTWGTARSGRALAC